MGEVTLTVVANELEAEMLCGAAARERDRVHRHERTNLAAGMATAGSSMGGPREVLVEEEQLEDAQKLLPADRVTPIGGTIEG